MDQPINDAIIFINRVYCDKQSLCTPQVSRSRRVIGRFVGRATVLTRVSTCARARYPCCAPKRLHAPVGGKLGFIETWNHTQTLAHIPIHTHTHVYRIHTLSQTRHIHTYIYTHSFGKFLVFCCIYWPFLCVPTCVINYRARLRMFRNRLKGNQ